MALAGLPCDEIHQTAGETPARPHRRRSLMSRTTALASRPVARPAAVTAALAALIAAPSPAPHRPLPGPLHPEVPSTIAVVGDFKPYLVGHAVGWQVHTCLPQPPATPGPSRVPWRPLHDDQGKLLASHSAGPTWTARDGSSVVADVVDRATVSPTAIPWLLLRTRTAHQRPGRRPSRGHHPRPAHRDHRRTDPSGLRVHRRQRRRDAVRPLHRGLRLLEGDRPSGA